MMLSLATTAFRSGVTTSHGRMLLNAAGPPRTGHALSTLSTTLLPVLEALEATTTTMSVRSFSSNNNNNNNNNHNNVPSNHPGKHTKFTPRRRSSPLYRPVEPRLNKFNAKRHPSGSPKRSGRAGKGVTMYGGDGDNLPLQFDEPTELGDSETPAPGSETDLWERADGLSRIYGPDAARAIRYLQRMRRLPEPTIEDQLRNMDYLTAAEGSTEDLVGERRALAEECSSPEEAKRFLAEIDRMVEEQRLIDMELEPEELAIPKGKGGVDGDDVQMDMNDPLTSINPNQLAYGEWYVMLMFVC